MVEELYMIRLIQGMFFQGVGGVLHQTMYAGVIFSEKGRLAGNLRDFYGDSVLSLVLISPKEIQFTKKYAGREDLIHYTFKRRTENGIWVGEYTGDRVGKGISKCVITEIADSFFSPDPELS
jgi:hypothetical protein